MDVSHYLTDSYIQNVFVITIISIIYITIYFNHTLLLLKKPIELLIEITIYTYILLFFVQLRFNVNINSNVTIFNVISSIFSPYPLSYFNSRKSIILTLQQSIKLIMLVTFYIKFNDIVNNLHDVVKPSNKFKTIFKIVVLICKSLLNFFMLFLLWYMNHENSQNIHAKGLTFGFISLVVILNLIDVIIEIIYIVVKKYKHKPSIKNIETYFQTFQSIVTKNLQLAIAIVILSTFFIPLIFLTTDLTILP